MVKRFQHKHPAMPGRFLPPFLTQLAKTVLCSVFFQLRKTADEDNYLFNGTSFIYRNMAKFLGL